MVCCQSRELSASVPINRLLTTSWAAFYTPPSPFSQTRYDHVRLTWEWDHMRAHLTWHLSGSNSAAIEIENTGRGCLKESPL